MIVWLFVAIRIVANPVSNVFQKRLTQRGAEPAFVITATFALLTIAVLPLVFLAIDFDARAAFLANIVAASLLAFVGNALLVAALKSSDLSVLGPINAYKALVGMVLAVFFVPEIPTAAGMFGVLLILAGNYFVVERNDRETRRNALVQFFSDRGVQLRFAALGVSATEAVFLKRALLASPPLTAFVFWCVLGLPISAIAVSLLRRGSVRDDFVIFHHNVTTYCWLAVTTGLMQYATLFTFGRLQVGYSLALFQLSAVLSILLGGRYFDEQNIGKRLIGTLVMAAGAALIIVFGRTS